MNARASKSFPQFFLRNRAGRAAVQRERDGYVFDCLVRNLGLGALVATWMAQRQFDATLSFSEFAERQNEVAEQPFQVLEASPLHRYPNTSFSAFGFAWPRAFL